LRERVMKLNVWWRWRPQGCLRGMFLPNQHSTFRKLYTNTNVSIIPSTRPKTPNLYYLILSCFKNYSLSSYILIEWTRLSFSNCARSAPIYFLMISVSFYCWCCLSVYSSRSRSYSFTLSKPFWIKSLRFSRAFSLS